MKIAHISDVHCRPLKYHSDYRRVFEGFYRDLEEQRVDLVVNTGDLVHAKLQLSPELVELVSEFLTEVAKRAPILSVLGNHDLNLMNADRQDAISPIVGALDNPRVVLLKKSGGYTNDALFSTLKFWNLGIADVEHWPCPPYDEHRINIGLFHGSIRNCVTDSLFRMTHTEYDTDIFEGLDFVFMGDIHKRQSFNDGRVWYAGSMVQQNFGEDPDKGYLLWDIQSKDDFDVTFRELKGARRFYTVRLPEDLRVPELDIEPDSRIRIAPPRPLTLVEQKTAEKIVRRRYAPHDVITLGVASQAPASEGSLAGFKAENLRDMGVQEQLLRCYLSDRQLPEDVVDRVLGLNRKYQQAAEQREDMARGVSWRVLKMGWNNLYNFGEGNVVDFSQIRGLTGLFAPNASGKSGLIDTITVGMFDANTKEVAKNIHLVNDNRERADVILELLANGERYTVQRSIERVKFGKRKGEEREWGKTSLDFVRHEPSGGVEKLVGESRPETERNIRRRFGSFEDFMLTSLFAQWDPMDLIMCKETDRKRVLFRFLDLDVFEEKAKLAKEESKVWLDRLADLEENSYDQLLARLQEEQSQDQMQLFSLEGMRESNRAYVVEASNQIEELVRRLVQVESELRRPDPARTDRLRQAISAGKERVQAKARAVADLKDQLQTSELDVGDRSELLAEYNEDEHEQVEAQLEVTRESLVALKRKHRDRSRQVGLLLQVPCGDSYPACQFLVNAFSAKRDLPQLEQEMADLAAKEAALSSRADELAPLRVAHEAVFERAKEVDRLSTRVRMAELELENLSLSIGKAEAELAQAALESERYERSRRDLESNESVQVEIDRLKKERAGHEEWVVQLDHELVGLHQRMGARATDLERLEKQVAQTKEVKDTCTAYEHFLAAMGKDGIALQVLSQKLPVINEEIGKILGSAAEFGVHIEYDREDQSIRLYIRYGEYKSRVLELGSGAEKFLASVAIRAALLSVSNLPRSNMFIIDEGFGKLDPQNLESVQRMFDYLRSVFDHVIVISHTDALKDMVDNVIDIVPDEDGYAHCEVGG